MSEELTMIHTKIPKDLLIQSKKIIKEKYNKSMTYAIKLFLSDLVNKNESEILNNKNLIEFIYNSELFKKHKNTEFIYNELKYVFENFNVVDILEIEIFEYECFTYHNIIWKDKNYFIGKTFYKGKPANDYAYIDTNQYDNVEISIITTVIDKKLKHILKGETK